jgi:sulfate permease, SulP family
VPAISLPGRRTLQKDAAAGLVLGVQSVPDGLATGILAGLSPLAGLNAYIAGTLAGAAVTSSTFMIVQGTGAMAMVISDVDVVQRAGDPDTAAFTLAVLTGGLMLLAGVLKAGAALRFVSNAVMVGFMNAVGVSIVLGQLGNLTGYAADGPNRVVRAVDTVLSPGELDWPSVTVGALTVVLILVLERTALKALGLVVAVVVASALPAVVGWTSVRTLDDLGVDIGDLPTPAAPDWALVPELLIPAFALTLVGLIQGAGISGTFVNPDGRYPDASRDFLGQGTANVAAGIFQGMPVGGSVSASLINKAAGARSRWAGVIAAVVMATVVVTLGDVVGRLALPTLAGLLMLVGVRSVKPADIAAVWHTGLLQKSVFVVTFALTLVMPLQYAVLVGVGLSVVLHAARQSAQVSLRRRILDDEGFVLEVDPPPVLPSGEVVVLQPYGSLFFAAAPVLEAALPQVREQSTGSVVLLRLRGRSDLGSTFMDVLLRYARDLEQAGSRLVVVSANERIQDQLRVTGVATALGPGAIYATDDRVGLASARALADANDWVAAQREEHP